MFSIYVRFYSLTLKCKINISLLNIKISRHYYSVSLRNKRIRPLALRKRPDNYLRLTLNSMYVMCYYQSERGTA